MRAALAGALEAIRGSREGSGTTREEARDALKAEAAKGLKKGIPEKLGWFPFEGLPEVRWRRR